MDTQNTVGQVKYALLVPCYNAQKYIGKFIENLSLLNRPFDEVIFYDDASTDDTAAILTSHGYRVIKGRVNKGPGFARNRLAEIARCPYIHFHDIDDEFNPAFLTLVDEQLTNTATDVIIGYADWVDETTRDIIIQWQYNDAGISKNPVSYFISNPVGIINTIYSKACFMHIKGFNEDIKCWEDADLHVRLAAAGAHFSIINEVIAVSVRHNNGVSKNQDWCWACRVKFLEQYKIILHTTHQPVIGAEFEKSAYNLFTFGHFSKAIKAFNHGRNCGYNAPETNNMMLKNIKKLSPLLAFLFKAALLKIKRAN